MTWEPFAEIVSSERGFTPPVDIYEDAEAILVKVELPGVRPEDIVVDAGEHVLVIRGERRPERNGGVYRIERAFGAFARTFMLPGAVDGPAAVAVMADGVLTIRIPKRGSPAWIRRAS